MNFNLDDLVKFYASDLGKTCVNIIQNKLNKIVIKQNNQTPEINPPNNDQFVFKVTRGRLKTFGLKTQRYRRFRLSNTTWCQIKFFS